MKHGYTIKAGDTTYSVSGCPDGTWAFLKCIRFAKMGGWTNPKWYEFWRHGDTRFSESDLAFAESCLEIMDAR